MALHSIQLAPSDTSAHIDRLQMPGMSRAQSTSAVWEVWSTCVRARVNKQAVGVKAILGDSHGAAVRIDRVASLAFAIS